MDYAAAQSARRPAPHWSGLLWRPGLACLLGIIAFLPYDLSIFVPGVPAFLFSYFGWYGPQGRIVISLRYTLFAEAAFALIMLLSLLADRRIRRRWPALVGAGLLLPGILLALVVFLLSQDLLDVVFVAGFSRGLGGLPFPIDFYPFLFAAIAAAFVLGAWAPEGDRWRQAGFFILIGVFAVAGGAALHTLALLATHGQDAGAHWPPDHFWDRGRAGWRAGRPAGRMAAPESDGLDRAPAGLVFFALFALALAEVQTDGRALKAKGQAQLIFKVALIRPVQQFRIVDEKDKGRRADLRLGRVIHAQHAPLDVRGRMAQRGVLDRFVQFCGGDAPLALLVNLERRVQNRRDMIARLGGSKNHRRVGDELQIALDSFF